MTTSESASRLASLLIRNIGDVELEHMQRPPLYDSQGARLSEGTAARKLGASVDILAPGMRGCPYHLHHTQEEMFVVLEGEGTLRVAGELLPIRTGDVIFIPSGPEYPHQIINSSEAPLKYMSISTMERPEVCEYPDSGKFLVKGSQQGCDTLRVIGRSEQSLDYWDGEP
jgi:uncharacterized cupin superfamily protein